MKLRRVWSFLLAVTMLIGMLPMHAHAAGCEFCGGIGNSHNNCPTCFGRCNGEGYVHNACVFCGNQCDENGYIEHAPCANCGAVCEVNLELSGGEDWPFYINHSKCVICGGRCDGTAIQHGKCPDCGVTCEGANTVHGPCKYCGTEYNGIRHNHTTCRNCAVVCKGKSTDHNDCPGCKGQCNGEEYKHISCSVCGKTCDENGHIDHTPCAICGAVCWLSFSDKDFHPELWPFYIRHGVCPVCKENCDGSATQHGACAVCGAVCTGIDTVHNTCTVCGELCNGTEIQHSKCLICGAECDGINTVHHICPGCGQICQGENTKHTFCEYCGGVCDQHNACIVCGGVCTGEGYLHATCKVCGVVCQGEDTVHNTCERCGGECDSTKYLHVIEITEQPKDVTALEGDTVIFNVAVTACEEFGYQWQWRKQSDPEWNDVSVCDSKTASISVPATAEFDGGQFRCKITDLSGNVVYSDSATLHLKEAISISEHPGNVSTSAGMRVTFRVVAIGENLTYQWQYWSTSAGNWKDTTLTGAKTSELRIPATLERNGMRYRCVVTDVAGNSVISNWARLSVCSGPYFSRQPQSVTANLGDSVSFNVGANGYGVTCRWQYRKSSADTWKNSTVVSADSPTLKLTATTARNGFQYRCVLTDKFGNKVYSNVATLMVVTQEDSPITTHPVSTTGKTGDTVYFKVETNKTGLKYQWQWRKNSRATWDATTLAGNKTTTITVPVTVSRDGYQYRCMIKDAQGRTFYSDAATLTVVRSKMEIIRQPEDVTVNGGDDVTFSVVVTGDVRSYRWQCYDASTGKWQNLYYTGSTSATLKLSTTYQNVKNGDQYRCMIDDYNGNVICSKPATLTINSEIEITNQPADATDALDTTVFFKVVARGDDLKYQWQWRKNASAEWAATTVSGNKTDTIYVPVTTGRNGYQYRCVITDSYGKQVVSNYATLTVSEGKGTLTITEQPQNLTAYVGSKATFKVVAAGDGLTYQWQYRTGSNSAWKVATVSGAKTNVLSVAATWERNGMRYRCIITDSRGSVVISDEVKLDVQSAPKKLRITTQPVSITANLGDQVYFFIHDEGEKTTYQWQYRTSPTGTWKNVTVDGAKSRLIYLMATAARAGFQYRCVVTDAFGNQVVSQVATLTVATTENSPIVGQPQSVTVKRGETANFEVITVGEGLKYQWQFARVNSNTWDSTIVTGNRTPAISITISENYTGSSQYQYKYRCKITDANGRVFYSDAVTLTIQ